MAERRSRRGTGAARGLWKLVQKLGEPAPKPEPMPMLEVLRLEQPRMLYRVVEDQQFPGTWRAEPANYQGRGFVYLFKGEYAKWEAMAFAKNKNHRDGFSS